MFNKAKNYSQKGWVDIFLAMLFWGFVFFMIYFFGNKYSCKKTKDQAEQIGAQALHKKDDQKERSCDKKTTCVCRCE